MTAIILTIGVVLLIALQVKDFIDYMTGDDENE